MITYDALSKSYSSAAPQGFREFTRKYGVTSPNTCAVRLSYALFNCDNGFFKNVRAPLADGMVRELPTVAADLANNPKPENPPRDPG